MGRVQTEDQLHPVLCLCQLGQVILHVKYQLCYMIVYDCFTLFYMCILGLKIIVYRINNMLIVKDQINNMLNCKHVVSTLYQPNQLNFHQSAQFTIFCMLHNMLYYKSNTLCIVVFARYII